MLNKQVCLEVTQLMLLHPPSSINELLRQTLESCFQEQLKLQAQVRLLEQSVKQQQAKIVQLLIEKDMQYRDKGSENSVIDLGEEREYKGLS